jgi:hypothetical protein
MAKMAKEGFSRAAIEERKYLIKKPHPEVREENTRGVEFPGHEKVKAAIQRHPAMLRQNQTSGCHPSEMALQRICRHTGDATEQVHLPPPDAECGLRSRLHLRPARHLPQPLTLPELNNLKSSIFRLDIRIRIQLFPVRNFSMMMRIPSTMTILIQMF